MTRGPQQKMDKTIIRKVRFQTSVRVILIPSRPEYIAAGLLPVLWWEKSDFPLFKTAAVSEVISIMQLRNIKNCKDAMRLLYQTDLRSDSPETVFESDMEVSDSDSTPRSLDDKMSDSSSVDNESPRSCLKQKFPEEKTVKRPISCLAKEERYNHVQRHLHPLAYMCDWWESSQHPLRQWIITRIVRQPYNVLRSIQRPRFFFFGSSQQRPRSAQFWDITYFNNDSLLLVKRNLTQVHSVIPPNPTLPPIFLSPLMPCHATTFTKCTALSTLTLCSPD